MSEVMEVTASLKNVWFAPVSGGKSIAYGYIYGDTKGRFLDGTHIRTSIVEKIEGDVITTRNSVYRIESFYHEAADL